MDKKIKIRFDANTSPDLSFNFKPAKNLSEVKIGEVNTIKFLVENQQPEPEKVISTFNTSPQLLVSIFKNCSVFVLKKQTIKPNEIKEFTVAYYIDPKIVEDPATKGTSEITLSYSLFKKIKD